VTQSSGKYSDRSERSTRLGQDQFKVINQRTLSRTWRLGAQQRTMTITTQGKSCTARLDITGSSEYTALSTELNQMAVYRNAQVESITCRIE
jgi:hypothetical protein